MFLLLFSLQIIHFLKHDIIQEVAFISYDAA